jgi:hypothetical protein
MSSTTVSVPKYRHHKGSGQAFVQIKGRRHYLGVWDSPESKDRYSRFVAELAASPTAATLQLPLTTPALQINLCVRTRQKILIAVVLGHDLRSLRPMLK